MILKEKLSQIIPEWRGRVSELVKEHGEVEVDRVTISQIYGGMRNIKSLVTDISYVDAHEGIRLRGFTIPNLLKSLPKPKNGNVPLAGGLYYLLLVGEMPSHNEAMEVEDEWKNRAFIPEYVLDMLKAMPPTANPMTLFSQAILGMQVESKFAKKLMTGIRKEDFWGLMLEDSLDLTARLPIIAAYIYNLKIREGQKPKPNQDLDWSANFGYMIGITDPAYYDLTRLYFIIHSDHESGNVSAHTTHLVASSLADIYLATSAGMNGLAGPLHGRANQEVLKWLLDVKEHFQRVPSEEELHQYAWDSLNAGQLIPGYGHAVLRKTDPRYTVLHEFGMKHMPDDEIFQLADLVYKVVPQVLIEQGKVKDPWPNVDAISGSLQYHFGIRDCDGYGACDFYTVLFGVSRILGVTANAVWARALNQPIERPKSMTTAMLEELTHKS